MRTAKANNEELIRFGPFLMIRQAKRSVYWGKRCKQSVLSAPFAATALQEIVLGFGFWSERTFWTEEGVIDDQDSFLGLACGCGTSFFKRRGAALADKVGQGRWARSPGLRLGDSILELRAKRPAVGAPERSTLLGLPAWAETRQEFYIAGFQRRSVSLSPTGKGLVRRSGVCSRCRTGQLRRV
jgi:hypothetical protein